MPGRLPPLNALKAFESAARHLSLKRAAQELNVTPAAISHQVKALEDYLGVKLFLRLNRALKLTATARAALPKLSEGFGSLAQAVGAPLADASATSFFRGPPRDRRAGIGANAARHPGWAGERGRTYHHRELAGGVRSRDPLWAWRLPGFSRRQAVRVDRRTDLQPPVEARRKPLAGAAGSEPSHPAA